ncbi:MAG: hypothetical protein K0S32_3490 [Bacteroidetes bacterium]|jgi:antitoxin component YwqK of YwqJK toxin-antitoxin module|nr:hypothetical protein [Bacteroidota bacterium]
MKKTVTVLLLSVSTLVISQTKTETENYPSGSKKSETTIKDGKKNGPSKYYFENGQVAVTMEYKNDSLVGTLKEFSETGNLQQEIDAKTLKAKIYLADGNFLIGKYADRNFKVNGTWEDWEGTPKYKRFEWTYVDGVKEGPYKALRRNGTVEAAGYYKKGTLSDSLKYYDEKGKLEQIEIWKVEGDGETSTLVNTIYFTDKKSDGTPEVIDGKLYIWKNGKKEFVQKMDE